MGRWEQMIQKIELKSWKKVLEKSNQKLKGKVKKKSNERLIEVEEKGLLNLYEDSSQITSEAIRKWIDYRENISEIGENQKNSRENWRKLEEQQRKLEEQQRKLEKIGENQKNSRVGCRSGLGTTITTLVKTIVNLGFRDSSTSFLLFNSNKKREVSLPLFYLSPLKNLATTSSSLLLLMETETDSFRIS